jgi:transcription initiation factor TFIIIB Brf1 subunit/transcription initiation factor TFIIB
MMDKYGPYFSDSFDKKNVEIPPENFIARHQFNPILRRKLVDWMIEIFYKLDSDENTFFAAVRIMDKFIWKCPSIITEKSIYKVGVTCIYIASKTYDYYPIKMKELIHKISHDSLQEQIVKKLEGMILTAINFDIMSPGPSEFIQFLLYDLYMNNKGIISRYRLRNIIDIVENCAIWTAKMCYHFEKYSSKSPNHIAVACLFIGYEMAKDNKHLNSNEKQFFVEWLEYLLQKIGINEEGKNYINNLYKDIYQTFIKFKKMSYKNLVKFHYLFFE